jgi:hypothetical protein
LEKIDFKTVYKNTCSCYPEYRLDIPTTNLPTSRPAYPAGHFLYKVSFNNDSYFWIVCLKTLRRQVDWSARCETPAGLACHPPEKTSSKACDEEAHFGRMCLQTQEHMSFLEYRGSPHASRKTSTMERKSTAPKPQSFRSDKIKKGSASKSLRRNLLIRLSIIHALSFHP